MMTCRKVKGSAYRFKTNLYLGIHLRRVVQRRSHTRRFRSPLSSRVGTDFAKAATGTLPVTRLAREMNQMQDVIIEPRGKIWTFRELEHETTRRIIGDGLHRTLLECSFP